MKSLVIFADVKGAVYKIQLSRLKEKQLLLCVELVASWHLEHKVTTNGLCVCVCVLFFSTFLPPDALAPTPTSDMLDATNNIAC